MCPFLCANVIDCAYHFIIINISSFFQPAGSFNSIENPINISTEIDDRVPKSNNLFFIYNVKMKKCKKIAIFSFLKLEFFSKKTEQIVFITENVLSFARFKSVISRKGIRFFEHFQMWSNVEIDIFLESSDILVQYRFKSVEKSIPGNSWIKKEPAGNAKTVHLKNYIEEKMMPYKCSIILKSYADCMNVLTLLYAAIFY